MCYKPELKIATEPVKVFKIMVPDKENADKIASFYYSFTGRIGKEYTSDIVFYNSCTITRGFHSYSSIKCAVDKEYPNETAVYVQKGEQKVYLDAFRQHWVVKVKCTLPIGTHYYENENGEIVSNRIIFDSIEPL